MKRIIFSILGLLITANAHAAIVGKFGSNHPVYEDVYAYNKGIEEKCESDTFILNLSRLPEHQFDFSGCKEWMKNVESLD